MGRLVLILLILSWEAAWAQQATDTSATVAVMWTQQRNAIRLYPTEAFEKEIIPIKMIGRLAVIEARIDTLVGAFILDTGAPYLILNKTWFRDQGATSLAQAGGITGALSDVKNLGVREFQLGKLTYKDFEADIIELAHLEASRGIPILGLIGLNFFTNMELEINYQQQQIILFALDERGNRLVKEEETRHAEATVPFYLNNGIIFIDGSLNDVNMRFCFDTGAELNVFHNRLPKKAMQNISITSRSILTGTSNQKTEVLRGSVSSLRLGDFICPDMSILLTNLTNMSRAYDTRVDGMIGYELLKMRSLSFNFMKAEITILPLKGGIE